MPNWLNAQKLLWRLNTGRKPAFVLLSEQLRTVLESYWDDEVDAWMMSVDAWMMCVGAESF